MSSNKRSAAAHVGALVRQWRELRRFSQTALALEVGISARHVSYVETGRSRPSQRMLLELANALEIPPRERNLLLLAAGYAPEQLQRPAGSPELAEMEQAIQLILDKQEPFPALAMDRHWNVLQMNLGATRLLSLFIGLPAPFVLNGPRLIFHPAGLRPFVEDWEATAARLLQRIHRAALVNPSDVALRELLEEMSSYGDVPERGRTADLETPPPPAHPISLRRAGEVWCFYSTITTLGTAQDVTLQELRIECFFPADALTRAALESLPSNRSAQVS